MRTIEQIAKEKAVLKMDFINRLCAKVMGVCAYRPIWEDDPVASAWIDLITKLQTKDSKALTAYGGLFFALRREGFHGLGDWLNSALRYKENPYADLIARGGDDPVLVQAARQDLALFNEMARTDGSEFIDCLNDLLGEEYADTVAALPRWTPGKEIDFEELTEFYRVHGAGLFAKYKAFLWEDGQLFPVEQPDSPKPEELLGYEMQREQVIANTRALVAGHAVNNVLLFGDSGTGKSATVKSLLTQPGLESLRLIEVQKDGLSDMTRLIRTLRSKPQKFILFIDDLAFDQDDKVFSALKTILEGGLEPRPANVAVYATSNRRHLVRQTFSERAGEEVDTFETISEKTALAERFGLRIPYQNMDKRGYLALVDHLAAREGIQVEQSKLHAMAMQWDIRHGGRTPRSARQFVASLSVE